MSAARRRSAAISVKTLSASVLCTTAQPNGRGRTRSGNAAAGRRRG